VRSSTARTAPYCLPSARKEMSVMGCSFEVDPPSYGAASSVALEGPERVAQPRHLRLPRAW
jgi:hypothetical protein